MSTSALPSASPDSDTIPKTLEEIRTIVAKDLVVTEATLAEADRGFINAFRELVDAFSAIDHRRQQIDYAVQAARFRPFIVSLVLSTSSGSFANFRFLSFRTACRTTPARSGISPTCSSSSASLPKAKPEGQNVFVSLLVVAYSFPRLQEVFSPIAVSVVGIAYY